MIPTLNAAGSLDACLARLRASALIGETVVADGGSGDGTAAVARAGT
ncbi:MAG: glycosyl transferase family 2, partial [Stellaceae bacterium]